MMALPAGLPRSVANRAWRSGVAILAIGIAYVAGAQALADATEAVSPDKAFALAPWDGQIGARYARSLVPETTDKSRLEQADRTARRALRREGLALDAITTLGLDAQTQGEERLARRYLSLAQHLSRRNLAIQLWAIEDAVSRGNIAEAVVNYDIALRTNRDARKILFPILAAAIADPKIADAMTRTLATNPYWAPDFIFFLAKEGADPEAAARLFDRLATAHVSIAPEARTVLVENLIAKRDFDGAWASYVKDHPTADRRRSRDPHFTNDQGSRSSFDWQLLGDAGSISIERGSVGNVLSFSVPTGSGGLLARQMQLLPPGSYSLRSVHSGSDEPASARLTWSLSCWDGRSLTNMPLLGSQHGTKETAIRFTVPPGCNVQWLSLIAPPSDGNIRGEVIEASLEPIP